MANSLNELMEKFLQMLYKAQVENIDVPTVRQMISDFANNLGDYNIEFIEKVNKKGYADIKLHNVMRGKSISINKPYITLDGIEYLKQLQLQREEINNPRQVGFQT